MNYTNETMDSAIRQKPLRGVRFEANDAEVFFANLDTLMDVTVYEWYVDDVELKILVGKQQVFVLRMDVNQPFADFFQVNKVDGRVV